MLRHASSQSIYHFKANLLTLLSAIASFKLFKIQKQRKQIS